MDKLRMGVIGLGGRGHLADGWMNNARSTVVAGANVSEQELAAFRERAGEGAFAATDWRRVIEREDVDAVAVLAPDFLHEEMAVAALEAGKHVFCEKPLAISTAACDHILRAWKASGKHLMVGFNMRYMNIFRVMKEMIDEGTIGEVRAAWCRHFVGFGGRWYYHDWHAKRAGTNSLLLQKASHDLDMIHWLTGANTQRVSAFGSLDFYGGDKPNDLRCSVCDERRECSEYVDWPGHEQCVWREEVEVEDNSVVIMELERGIKASYMQCHFTPDYERNYVIIGTEGRVENSEPKMKVWVKTRKGEGYKFLSDRTHEVKEYAGGHAGGDPRITEDFLDMVLEGKQPVATPLAGRMSVAAGCAAAESMRGGGGVVEVPEVEW